MGLSGGQGLQRPMSAPHVSRTTTNAPRAKPCLAARTYTLTHRSTRFDGDREPTRGDALFGRDDLHTHARLATFRERPRTHAWAKPCLAARTYTLMHHSTRSESDHERTHGRSPVWRGRPTHSCTARNVPRATTNPRMGEALFGRNDLQRQDRSQCPESDRGPTHGRSPVWRADPRCSYERNLPSRTPRVAARLGWSFLITP
jgi:hypothetical protein